MILVSFVFILVENAKMQAEKCSADIVSSVCVQSAFSEYDKVLYEKYGLMYVDTTYKGTKPGGDESFINHLSEYVDVNTYETGNKALSYLSADIFGAEYADDNGYESLKKQISKVIIQKEGYAPSLSDEEILNIYISLKTEDDQADEYFSGSDMYGSYSEYVSGYGDDYSYEYDYPEYDYPEYDSLTDYVISNLTYDEKLCFLVDYIEKDMCKNAFSTFDFSKHLKSGDVTVYIKGSKDRVYESVVRYDF